MKKSKYTVTDPAALALINAHNHLSQEQSTTTWICASVQVQATPVSQSTTVQGVSELVNHTVASWFVQEIALAKVGASSCQLPYSLTVALAEEAETKVTLQYWKSVHINIGVYSLAASIAVLS